MIGVDFKANHPGARRASTSGTAGSKRLGEYDGDATVKEAVGLTSSAVHRHACSNEVIADLDELNAEVLNRCALGSIGKELDGDMLLHQASRSHLGVEETMPP